MGSMAYETRERDRHAALEARRTALRVVPVVAAVWVLLVVLVESDFVVRAGSLATIVVSVVLGARAAVTARTYVRRWLDEDARRPPPYWVTLVAVAGAVGTLVAGANVVADISASRSALRALVFLTLLSGVTLVAILAHVTGGRGVAAALRVPTVETRDTTPDNAGAAVAGASGAPRVAELRLLLQGYLGAGGAAGALAAADRGSAVGSADDDGGGLRVSTVAAAVAAFRRDQPGEVVAAARTQVGAIQVRRLGEPALAQVLTLLGCDEDPTERGSSYRELLAELEAALRQ